MPFALKALLVVAGVFVAGWVVISIVSFALHSLLYIAIGAYRRRQLQKKRDY